MKAADSQPDPEDEASSEDPATAESSAIICPVCGAATVPEKCKVVCKSEICRGRVIMNCAEF